jgi:NAD(P)-dependent dehydrogenase (short-subunit alcohol dehydrogenase family)
VILREGLLAGVEATVTGAPAVAARFEALGAALVESEPAVLVLAGAPEPLAALDGAWETIRAHALPHMTERGGQILLLAPAPGDAHAQAARGGLENLARTLSVEWSRFGVRPVTILPGARTSDAELAELAAFLASPAGQYYSGCAFTLV